MTAVSACCTGRLVSGAPSALAAAAAQRHQGTACRPDFAVLQWGCLPCPSHPEASSLGIWLSHALQCLDFCQHRHLGWQQASAAGTQVGGLHRGNSQARQVGLSHFFVPMPTVRPAQACSMLLYTCPSGHIKAGSDQYAAHPDACTFGGLPETAGSSTIRAQQAHRRAGLQHPYLGSRGCG